MKRSRELRQFVLEMYRVWMESGFPTELLSSSPDLTATLTGGRIAPGREIALMLEAERELVPDITPGPLVAFEEGTVGWVADSPRIGLRGLPEKARFSLLIVLHREDDAWKIVYFSNTLRADDEIAVQNIASEYMANAIDRLTAALEADRPDLGLLFGVEGAVTLMFTDIEASTATNQALGDERWAVVLRQHNTVLRDATEASSGKVIRFLGDGFLLAFPTARQAVECAVAIQGALRQALSEWPVRVRMGLHLAEPIRDEGDFLGHDVAYAARVGEAARGQEILVSAVVRTALDGAFAFDGPRALEFKGFDGTHDVYAVVYE
jgi:class 3 adenylate cyclase